VVHRRVSWTEKVVSFRKVVADRRIEPDRAHFPYQPRRWLVPYLLWYNSSTSLPAYDSLIRLLTVQEEMVGGETNA